MMCQQQAYTMFHCRHYSSALKKFDKLLQKTAHHYTEQSPETLRVLTRLSHALIHSGKSLVQAKHTFKMFQKLKANMTRSHIPSDVMERNRLNKAKFFLAKMKIGACKEAAKEL
jgi:hypothetical protein